MKVKELIQKLSKVDQDLEVIVDEINDSSHVWGVSEVHECESEGEFPDDYDMPEGYKYALITN